MNYKTRNIWARKIGKGWRAFWHEKTTLAASWTKDLKPTRAKAHAEAKLSIDRIELWKISGP